MPKSSKKARFKPKKLNKISILFTFWLGVITYRIPTGDIGSQGVGG